MSHPKLDKHYVPGNKREASLGLPVGYVQVYFISIQSRYVHELFVLSRLKCLRTDKQVLLNLATW